MEDRAQEERWRAVPMPDGQPFSMASQIAWRSHPGKRALSLRSAASRTAPPARAGREDGGQRHGHGEHGPAAPADLPLRLRA